MYVSILWNPCSTAMNRTKGRYYFELTTRPNVIWADLTKLNLNAGAPAMVLDLGNVDLSGDVTVKLEKLEKSPFWELWFCFSEVIRSREPEKQLAAEVVM